MQPEAEPQNAPFDTRFFPQHVTLLTVGENMMPMGYWTVISKDPFRFLICMQLGNHSLILLKKYQEAEAQYNQALGIRKDYLPAILGLAWVAIGRQDLEGAESQLKALTASHPHYQDAWSALAGLYRMQNRLDDSIAAYDVEVSRTQYS